MRTAGLLTVSRSIPTPPPDAEPPGCKPTPGCRLPLEADPPGCRPPWMQTPPRGRPPGADPLDADPTLDAESPWMQSPLVMWPVMHAGKLWTEWQTGVKTLPCPKLRLREVNRPLSLRQWKSDYPFPYKWWSLCDNHMKLLDISCKIYSLRHPNGTYQMAESL